jgi:transcriptional pleiotropic repressor
MSLELLDKTRKIYQLLNRQESDKVDFNDFCRVLSQEIRVNVLLLSRKGKVLGMREKKDIPPIRGLEKVAYGSYVDPSIQDRMLGVLSTKENVNLMTLGFSADAAEKYQAMVAPVNMAGKRLGTLFIYRQAGSFSIDDIILTEYGTTVVGLAMQRAESEELTQEQHKEQDLRDAVRTLSRLEAKAMLCVLDQLEEDREGMLVTSRLADQVGITRSVIVNALKKCESAGLIRTKSAGMKGTSICLLNDLFNSHMVRSCLED